MTRRICSGPGGLTYKVYVCSQLVGCPGAHRGKLAYIEGINVRYCVKYAERIQNEICIHSLQMGIMLRYYYDAQQILH